MNFRDSYCCLRYYTQYSYRKMRAFKMLDFWVGAKHKFVIFWWGVWVQGKRCPQPDVSNNYMCINVRMMVLL